MSRENVELHHRGLEAFNRRDLDAFVALTHADVRTVTFLAAIEGDFRGHDGVRRWLTTLIGAFPDFALEVVEMRDLGDVTVARLRNRGHGTDSDTPFEMTVWHVVEWRDGKAVSWGSYMTEAEALEAAELRE